MRSRSIVFCAFLLSGCGDSRPAESPAATSARVVAPGKTDVPFDDGKAGKHLFRGAIDTSTGKTPAACRLRNNRTECWGFVGDENPTFSRIRALKEFETFTMNINGAAFGPVAECVWTELGEAFCAGYFGDSLLSGIEKVESVSQVVDMVASGRGRFCARTADGDVKCFASPKGPAESFPFPGKVAQLSHEHPLSCVVDNKGEGFNLDRRITFSPTECTLYGKAPVSLAMCSSETSCVLGSDKRLSCTFEKSLRRKQVTLAIAEDVTVADGEADRLCYANGTQLTCVGTAKELNVLDKLSFASPVVEIIVHGASATVRTSDGNVWAFRLGVKSTPERLVAQ